MDHDLDGPNCWRVMKKLFYSFVLGTIIAICWMIIIHTLKWIALKGNELDQSFSLIPSPSPYINSYIRPTTTEAIGSKSYMSNNKKKKEKGAHQLEPQMSSAISSLIEMKDETNNKGRNEETGLDRDRDRDRDGDGLGIGIGIGMGNEAEDDKDTRRVVNHRILAPGASLALMKPSTETLGSIDEHGYNRLRPTTDQHQHQHPQLQLQHHQSSRIGPKRSSNRGRRNAFSSMERERKIRGNGVLIDAPGVAPILDHHHHAQTDPSSPPHSPTDLDIESEDSSEENEDDANMQPAVPQPTTRQSISSSSSSMKPLTNMPHIVSPNPLATMGISSEEDEENSSSSHHRINNNDNNQMREAHLNGAHLDKNNINLNNQIQFKAPFFTSWFVSMWNILFMPVFTLISSCCFRGEDSTTKRLLVRESISQFMDNGLTLTQFLSRCALFSFLWVGIILGIVYSLNNLDATAVMALFSFSSSLTYFLSWVILHQQFVGIRIVAVIICTTGIALLAYMDNSKALGSVLVVTASAFFAAIYKVLYQRMFGFWSIAQMSLFFTVIGVFNALVVWPIALLLYFLGFEVIIWRHIPWMHLSAAGALHLTANVVAYIGPVCSYDIFLTLGLLLSVVLSAVIDVTFYKIPFTGMKLGGILFLMIGFLVCLLPENWNEHIQKCFKKQVDSFKRRKSMKKNGNKVQDMSTGQISRLRTASGRVK